MKRPEPYSFQFFTLLQFYFDVQTASQQFWESPITVDDAEVSNPYYKFLQSSGLVDEAGKLILPAEAITFIKEIADDTSPNIDENIAYRLIQLAAGNPMYVSGWPDSPEGWEFVGFISITENNGQTERRLTQKARSAIKPHYLTLVERTNITEGNPESRAVKYNQALADLIEHEEWALILPKLSAEKAEYWAMFLQQLRGAK